MSFQHADRMSDDDVLATVRRAAQKCLDAGIYPSKVNLRASGARGGPSRLLRAREQLLATGELVIPDAMQERAERRPIVTRVKKIREMQECIPQSTVVVKPHRAPLYDSPVWDDLVAGVKAWKRLVAWKRLWLRRKEEPCVPGNPP